LNALEGNRLLSRIGIALGSVWQLRLLPFTPSRRHPAFCLARPTGTLPDYTIPSPGPLSMLVMAQDSHHDAYRFNNNRQMAAAMMAPHIAGSPDVYSPSLMHPVSQYPDQMAYVMGHLALTPPLPSRGGGMPVPGFHHTFDTSTPPFGRGSAQRRRKMAAESGRVFPQSLPMMSPHAFMSPSPCTFPKPMHSGWVPPQVPGWRSASPAFPPPFRRMNPRVPSTLNGNKVCATLAYPLADQGCAPVCSEHTHGAMDCNERHGSALGRVQTVLCSCIAFPSRMLLVMTPAQALSACQNSREAHGVQSSMDRPGDMQGNECAEFVPPAGAVKVQINGSLMGWVDDNGVVLHSWRKTKRGTRGSGQRRRSELDLLNSSNIATTPTTSELRATRPISIASSDPSSEHVTAPAVPSTAEMPTLPASVPEATVGCVSEGRGTPRAALAAEVGVDDGERDEHGLPTGSAGAMEAVACMDGAAHGLLTPRLARPAPVPHAVAAEAVAGEGEGEAKQVSPQSDKVSQAAATPESVLSGSSLCGTELPKVKVPVQDWEHLRYRHDQVCLPRGLQVVVAQNVERLHAPLFHVLSGEHSRRGGCAHKTQRCHDMRLVYRCKAIWRRCSRRCRTCMTSSSGWPRRRFSKRQPLQRCTSYAE
jgi:hypothetical protein